eukprot:TRINITY_DN3806_c0_g1_i17.p1 TRINITY_DN3806_c0_g1~~TRINITY_DN3806_c0_g1_i17.p1  ORF type:complete len:226 (+),score=55.10 TRINITY_DN3806_c0_g1_i17:21-698(+)
MEAVVSTQSTGGRPKSENNILEKEAMRSDGKKKNIKSEGCSTHSNGNFRGQPTPTCKFDLVQKKANRYSSIETRKAYRGSIGNSSTNTSNESQNSSDSSLPVRLLDSNWRSNSSKELGTIHKYFPPYIPTSTTTSITTSSTSSTSTSTPTSTNSSTTSSITTSSTTQIPTSTSTSTPTITTFTATPTPSTTFTKSTTCPKTTTATTEASKPVILLLLNDSPKGSI